jgi:glycogen operon protein
MAWNSGVEGETKDEAVRAFRARRVRNFLATLMFSRGVPMLVAGDEMRRTQLGNNNAYCQDNEISWLSWDLDGEPRELLEFTRRLVQLRKAHPVFRRRDFFRGTPVRGSRSKDIVWFRRDGEEMTLSDWTLPREPFLALLLAGDALDLVDDHGLHVQDDTFYVVLSASHQALTFRLPSAGWGERWELLVDTRESTIPARGGPFVAGDEVTFAPHTLALFVRVGRPSVPSWRAVGNVGG